MQGHRSIYFKETVFVHGIDYSIAPYIPIWSMNNHNLYLSYSWLWSLTQVKNPHDQLKLRHIYCFTKPSNFSTANFYVFESANSITFTIFNILYIFLQVLHFLSAMKPADVILQLMPCLIHAAIIKVVENGKFLHNMSVWSHFLTLLLKGGYLHGSF